MDKNEATWIAISALEYVIGLLQNASDKSESDEEHIAEKLQALAILRKEVE
jgi:hypothetical protein